MNQTSLAIIVFCVFLGSAVQAGAATEHSSVSAAVAKSTVSKSHASIKFSNSKRYSKASWYGSQFHGKKTASGQKFDMYAMSAAHKTLPLLSYAKVTNPKNHRSVIVRINDRGPFHGNRDMDLSYAAAKKLGIRGVESVTITPLGRNQSLSPLSKSNKAG